MSTEFLDRGLCTEYLFVDTSAPLVDYGIALALSQAQVPSI